MKKKLTLLTLCTIFTWVCAVAQTQTGIVRTLEKSKRPSQGIDGVNVEILEYPNAIVSKKGGKFSFTLKNKKLGDAFKVSRVTKKGYTLVDKYLQGRNFSYSPTVPIEIVMVSDKQLANDKKQIEDKALAKAKKTYEAHIAELEHQFEEKTINEKAYYAERERLLNNYDNYIKLIDEMAERYALTDYKGISDINREILKCIENAELERADSLINSKGDFNQREQELRSQMEFNQVTAELLTQSQKDAEFKLNDLAQDYYNKFTIFASNFQKDSATFYLERRAALDTTNLEWQSEAGLYIYKIINRHSTLYNHALIYLKRGLSQSIIQYGENNRMSAFFYSILGSFYNKKHDYNQALVNYFDELKINQLVFGEVSHETGITYNAIGMVFQNLHDYNNAEGYLMKAHTVLQKEFENQNIIMVYTNLGSLYNDMGDYSKSIDYTQKALNLERLSTKPNQATIALLYYNLGIITNRNGNYLEASNYFDKLFDFYEQQSQVELFNLSDNIYSNLSLFHKLNDYSQNIAHICSEHNDFSKGLGYLLKSLTIQKKVYGNKHPTVATSYCNIGDYIYYSNRDGETSEYQKALNYYQKALEIRERVYGKEQIETAKVYDSIGCVYVCLNNYARAIEYSNKALPTYIKEYGIDNRYVKRFMDKIEIYTTYSNSGY